MTRTPARRLAEVAKKVGVSEATVSRVLNGKAGVSDSTREAVLTALDVLGYERPTQLRGAARPAHRPGAARTAEPDLPRARRGHRRRAGPARVHPGALHPHRRRPVRGRLRGHAARAARVGGRVRRRPLRRARRPARPLPAAAQPRRPRRADQRGDRQPRLPVRGHRRRCPPRARRSATSPRSGTSASGWCSAPRTTCRRGASWPRSATTRRAPGLTVAPVEHALFSLEGGQAATTRMLREGVTGIICASDVLALGAIRAVRRTGLSVPGDVSVVGYDDSGWLNCTDPPLTTVRQPIESMGKAAVALLVNQMETRRRPRRRSCSSSRSWSSAARPAPPRCARRQKSRQSADTRLQKAEVSAAYGSPYPERARAFSRPVQLTHRAAPAGRPARLPPRLTPVGPTSCHTSHSRWLCRRGDHFAGRVTGHIWSPCLQSAARLSPALCTGRHFVHQMTRIGPQNGRNVVTACAR